MHVYRRHQFCTRQLWLLDKRTIAAPWPPPKQRGKKPPGVKHASQKRLIDYSRTGLDDDDDDDCEGDEDEDNCADDDANDNDTDNGDADDNTTKINNGDDGCGDAADDVYEVWSRMR